MWGRLSALVMLALGLIKTLLLRFAPGDSLRGFEERYGAEGILALSEEEAQILGRSGRCITCGRCDAGEGERVAVSQSGYRGMMQFALSGGRSLPDYDATSRTIAEVPDEAFMAAELLCPVEVPLLSLARLVRGHAGRQKNVPIAQEGL
jgi:hypothetical protein